MLLLGPSHVHGGSCYSFFGLLPKNINMQLTLKVKWDQTKPSSSEQLQNWKVFLLLFSQTLVQSQNNNRQLVWSQSLSFISDKTFIKLICPQQYPILYLEMKRRLVIRCSWHVKAGALLEEIVCVVCIYIQHLLPYIDFQHHILISCLSVPWLWTYSR